MRQFSKTDTIDICTRFI